MSREPSNTLSGVHATAHGVRSRRVRILSLERWGAAFRQEEPSVYLSPAASKTHADILRAGTGSGGSEVMRARPATALISRATPASHEKKPRALKDSVVYGAGLYLPKGRGRTLDKAPASLGCGVPAPREARRYT